MRSLSFEARVSDLDKAAVFARLADFERYPSYTDTVIAAEVERVGVKETRTAWEVKFRDGILKWIEREVASPEAGEISFKAIDGDLETFEGSWRVSEDSASVHIRLEISFDAGLGTLSDVVEPIAERTLRENFENMLRALTDDHVSILPDGAS